MMSLMCQKLTSGVVLAMSALLLKADIGQRERHVL
jgi:hypothetical protein